MTAQPIFRRRRTLRATRLLGWALMAAVCGFLMWIVFGGAAHADDPKAAARAIGNAGNSAARAIARESSNAADVPGYLKFPGPFPVASIRLKYVARPAAAERFVAREGDGSEPGEASATASHGEEEIGIPEPAGADEAGSTHEPAGPDLPSEPASWQGELELLPLPGEAGDAKPDAAAAETADAGSAPAVPPDASAGSDRGSDWG